MSGLAMNNDSNSMIVDLDLNEIEEVDGGAWLGRAVTAGLIVIGVGTGVALVAGVAVGIAVVAYDHYND